MCAYPGGISYDNNKSKSQGSRKLAITFLLIGPERVGISISFELFGNELR